MNDTLPLGMTPIECSRERDGRARSQAQTVSCVRSDSLPAASSYPSITLNVNVSQSAPATVTNTAVVGGGGEANLLNDTATDMASVVSSADMSVTDAGIAEPGRGRSQHYLYAGRHQQRPERGRQRDRGGYDSGEHDAGVDSPRRRDGVA